MAPPTTRIIIFLALALLLASSLVVAVDPSVDKEDAVETCANAEQQIEQVRKENADKLAAKDAEAANAAEEFIKLETDAKEKIRGLQEQIEFVKAEADREKADLLKSTQKKFEEAERIQQKAQQKIDEAEAKAQEKMRLLEMTQVDRDDDHRREISKLKAIHVEEIRAMEDSVETRIQAVYNEMEKAKETAEEKLISEQAKHAEMVHEMEEKMASADARLTALKGELLNVKAEAVEKRKRMDSDIQLLRSNSFKLEEEISLWKENHDSQGYCNITLIMEDGIRAWHTVSEDAVALYDEYLADFVDENLAPVYHEHIKPIYNQHVIPVYTEHISPFIRGLEMRASKEAQKARSSASKFVRQSSSSALYLVKEKDIDSVLPASMLSLLVRSSTDGDWAVDMMLKGLLTIITFLLVLRKFRGIFPLACFLCPLCYFAGVAQTV